MLEQLTYNSHPVRTHLDEQGEPWFCVADVGAILGMRSPHDFLRSDYCDQEGVRKVSDPSAGGQGIAFINEPNLYAMVLRSSKPEAKAFRRWITHEVLPEIRRTGRYQRQAPPVENSGGRLERDEAVDAQEVDDPVLSLAKGVIAMRSSQLRLERRVEDMEGRLGQLEGQARAARDSVAALPAPATPVGEMDKADQCTRVVEKIAGLAGIGFAEVWREAYREYDLRKSVSLTKRTEVHNRNKPRRQQLTKLQFVALHGDIDLLYGILVRRLQLATAPPIRC